MRLFVYLFVRGAVQRALVWLDAALANDIFNAASPVNSGTAAVTVVDGLYQEDVVIVPAVEPAVQPDVPKPEEASTQALSIPTLHPRHCMDVETAIFSQNHATDACTLFLWFTRTTGCKRHRFCMVLPGVQ